MESVCPCAVTAALIKDYYIQYFRLYLLLKYHYTLSIPSYSNMEVLASTNRMSAITFLSFYFSSKNGTRLHFYYTDPAHHNFDGSFVTHFIFATFLLLFMIPIRVQVVTIYNRLHFYRRFRILFKHFHCIFQAVVGLYWLAKECCQLQKPVCRLQKTTLRPSQQLVQTSPLLDEHVFASTTRPILICQPEESPLLTSLISRDTSPSAGPSFS